MHQKIIKKYCIVQKYKNYSTNAKLTVDAIRRE